MNKSHLLHFEVSKSHLNLKLQNDKKPSPGPSIGSGPHPWILDPEGQVIFSIFAEFVLLKKSLHGYQSFFIMKDVFHRSQLTYQCLSVSYTHLTLPTNREV